MQQQTWFLPNDQAFAGMGSSLSSLLDQSNMNSINDINEVSDNLFLLERIIQIIDGNYLVYSSSRHSISHFSQCDGFDETNSDFNSE